MDIEKLKDVRKQEGINSLPAFKVYQGGKLLGEDVGTYLGDIESIIMRNSTIPQMEMGVLIVGNPVLYKQTIAANKLVVVEFCAQSCGICKDTASIYAGFVKKYPAAQFVKVLV